MHGQRNIKVRVVKEIDTFNIYSALVGQIQQNN